MEMERSNEIAIQNNDNSIFDNAAYKVFQMKTRYIVVICLVVLAVLISIVPVYAFAEMPEETPMVNDTEYQTELLTVLGNIQGYLIFFVLVILLYFAYKFFRMFF